MCSSVLSDFYLSKQVSAALLFTRSAMVKSICKAAAHRCVAARKSAIIRLRSPRIYVTRMFAVMADKKSVSETMADLKAARRTALVPFICAGDTLPHAIEVIESFIFMGTCAAL